MSLHYNNKLNLHVIYDSSSVHVSYICEVILCEEGTKYLEMYIVFLFERKYIIENGTFGVQTILNNCFY